MKQVTDEKIESLKTHFEKLEDPRSERNRRHTLVNLIVISVLAIIAGADGPTDINLWAKQNRDWLQKFLSLSGGIPSRDCFRRILGRVDSMLFQEYFLAWLKEHFHSHMQQPKGGKTIGVDGKVISRSGEPLAGQLPTSIVSAWCSEWHMTLGQIAMEKEAGRNRRDP